MFRHKNINNFVCVTSAARLFPQCPRSFTKMMTPTKYRFPKRTKFLDTLIGKQNLTKSETQCTIRGTHLATLSAFIFTTVPKAHAGAGEPECKDSTPENQSKLMWDTEEVWKLPAHITLLMQDEKKKQILSSAPWWFRKIYNLVDSRLNDMSKKRMVVLAPQFERFYRYSCEEVKSTSQLRNRLGTGVILICSHPTDIDLKEKDGRSNFMLGFFCSTVEREKNHKIIVSAELSSNHLDAPFENFQIREEGFSH